LRRGRTAPRPAGASYRPGRPRAAQHGWPLRVPREPHRARARHDHLRRADAGHGGGLVRSRGPVPRDRDRPPDPEPAGQAAAARQPRWRRAGRTEVRTAITCKQLLDGTGAPPLRDGVAVVEDGRIAAVGPAAAVDLDGAEVVDAGDRTLLPGLL